MNKLVIIGNGFDLAHGLPTSYRDFLNFFWKNLESNYSNDFIKNFVFINPQYLSLFNYKKTTENYDDFITYLIKYAQEYNYFYNEKLIDLHTKSNRFQPIFKFKNTFFKLINNKNSIRNWVDIENEYYIELKKIVKQNLALEEKVDRAKKLNDEFALIKQLFEKYLLDEVCSVYDFNQFNDVKPYYYIYELLKPNLSEAYLNLKSDSVKNYIREFSFKEDKEFIQKYVSKEGEFLKTSEFFKSYLLSFNYTPTVSAHKFLLRKESKYKIDTNYIHGIIGDTNNPINFGFGDETDEDYKLIENLNENEFLKNFKSFQYSQTSEYNNLLSFVEDEKFQVIILGHSCGLSDRVLLNTIFEHENCRSIKVYYHKKHNGEDNYTDIIQNISRHFNNKKIMRRKIVSKPYCKPLSQDLNFKKKDKKTK